MNNDAEFLKRLLATFKIEADEHLRGITAGLLELERGSDGKRQAEIVETIFREAHSLKGAARAVNLTDTESLCQALESVFAAMKKEAVKPAPELLDLLQEVTDYLGRTLPAARSEKSHDEKMRQMELVRRLGAAARGQGAGNVAREEPKVVAVAAELLMETTAKESTSAGGDPGKGAPFPDRLVVPAMSETVRVSTAKLSSLLLQSEEMLSAKLAAGQRAGDLRSATAAFGDWKKEWAKISSSAQELRQLSRQPGDCRWGDDEIMKRPLTKVLDFIDWNSAFVKSMEARFADEARSAEGDSRVLGGMVNNLLEEMKKVLMFPFSSLLEILPKLVRDLARDSGKEVALTISGEEIEIDRRILEEMKDPLVHLVRNCIDHGIESPEERQRSGKPLQGRITVAVAPLDDKVEVTVSDDGAGIPLAGIKDALLRLDLVPPEEVDGLADAELLPYVFQSGLSTNPIITELSGRGLGLAIVREKVEKLGGFVSLDSSAQSGTRFRMLLPLTVATFRGIIVRVGERLFVLPSMNVERSVRFNRDEIATVENRETIRLNGEPVSLARLTDVLGLAPKAAAGSSEMVQAVILTAGGIRIAFLVDAVLNEQEVLLKALGKQLSRVRNVAGATVLGSGRVAPILNVPDLVKSAVKDSARSVHSPDAGGGGRKRSILVVEDSITTRTLLKNILESAGYDVATAVDGVDGLTLLKSGVFDIVVSDVDMPRMNGFELTAKIRGDKRLGGVPVVLVTALASREDRERGIDVGASAYLVKSSFDQSNLLEVLGRLI